MTADDTYAPGPPLLLNGRFLTRSITGVDRVAEELGNAIAELGGVDMRLALPSGEIVNPDSRLPGVIDLPRCKVGAGSGHWWEQRHLAAAAPERWLLSLCNTGPVLRRRQVVFIHDAQVFTQPNSYSRAFRLAYKALLPRLGRRAGVVATVSDFSRRELEQHGVVPKGRAIVVPNGADHMQRHAPDEDTCARHGLVEGRFFLAIGSLAPHKNLPMLIEAMTARSDQSIPLVIAGGGNTSVFRDAGLQERPGVRFLGRVTDGELRSLYQNARALLFPSLTEGFGLPPLEAMGEGCPVIATTGGAVPEACGDAALYADPAAPEEWSAAADKLAQDEEAVAALSAAGRKHAAQFTWRKSAERLLNAIGAAE